MQPGNAGLATKRHSASDCRQVPNVTRALLYQQMAPSPLEPQHSVRSYLVTGRVETSTASPEIIQSLSKPAFTENLLDSPLKQILITK